MIPFPWAQTTDSSAPINLFRYNVSHYAYAPTGSTDMFEMEIKMEIKIEMEIEIEIEIEMEIKTCHEDVRTGVLQIFEEPRQQTVPRQ
jgi:hypothetical protein